MMIKLLSLISVLISVQVLIVKKVAAAYFNLNPKNLALSLYLEVLSDSYPHLNILDFDKSSRDFLLVQLKNSLMDHVSLCAPNGWEGLNKSLAGD